MFIVYTASCPLLNRYKRSPKTCRAFTLIEMMIVVGISSILVFSALPSLSFWHAKSEASRVTQTLHSQLQSARQAAIARGVAVSLCGSNAQGVCQLRNFDQLQVFIDTNKNKTRDNDEALLTSSRLKIKGQLRLNNHTSLQFKPDGTTRTPASFIYCPAIAEPALIRRVTLSFTGRPYVAQNKTKPIKNAGGSAITCKNWVIK